MNKKTKGLVAAAAGAAILLGTGGTFALWFDSSPLNASVSDIATGDLGIEVAEFDGGWVWTKVSNSKFAANVGKDFSGELVPGDAIKWTWTQADLELLLSGDTLVANLYLDGVLIPNANPNTVFAPLTFDLQDGTFAFDDATGRFLIASGLTAEDIEEFTINPANAPTITVGFPVDGDGVTNFGHDTGYGRGLEIAGEEIVDISRVSIRLQQITD